MSYPRILVPSIVDPKVYRGGAGVCTESLLHLLQRPPLHAEIEIVPTTPNRYHQLRQLYSITKSCISSLPSKATFTYSRSFLYNVKTLLSKKKFDLVLLNGADLLWLIDELAIDLPCVLFSHNIEHLLFQQQIDYFLSRMGVDKKTPSFLRFLLQRDGQRLQKYEMEGMKQVQNIIFLSDQDAAYIAAKCPQIKSIVVPPLFFYPAWRRSRSITKQIHLGFIANFNWWPNLQGLQWFLDKIFAYTKENVFLHLFGIQSQKFANPPRIIAHGFLPKINDVWKICDFMICPILSGGGVNIKFAEAIYNGMPVLATSFAARGTLLPHDSNIIILDHAQEWQDFLHSPMAQQLGVSCISSDIADIFTVEFHLAKAQNFIYDVLRNNNNT